jgi:hypothetical protein
LIATVFAAALAAVCAAIQRQSTCLSTAFCGYREIHYNVPANPASPPASLRRANLPLRERLPYIRRAAAAHAPP